MCCRLVWLLVLATLSTGCVIGAGPVMSVRTSGRVAVGWEATSNYAVFGAEVGQSIPIGSRGFTTYGALHGAWSPEVASQARSYLGASLGGATGEDHNGVMAALWPMYVGGFTNDCNTMQWLWTVQLGIRWLPAGAEVYLGPKVIHVSCSNNT